MSRESAARIEAQAAHWLMRLDREGHTPELDTELHAWLAGDTRRRGAWLQAEAAWLLLDGLATDLAEAGPDAPVAERSEVFTAANDGDERRMNRRRMLIGGAAAALAASFAGGIYLLRPAERYETAVGEIRRVPLADGSTAAINTQSDVTIAFAPTQRIVKLDRGEAFFQVAHDRSRPFVVEAGRIRAMAVGTAFAVRRREGGADVMVTEGVVEAWADGAEGARIRLAAGERAFIADDAGIQRGEPASGEVDRALSWRSGRIDLAGETLGQAADEFNRYNSRHILIVDPRISQERFYGIFRTDDPEGFALAVHGSLGAPVRADGAGIRIGRPAS
jgi:transmembrane sensor